MTDPSEQQKEAVYVISVSYPDKALQLGKAIAMVRPQVGFTIEKVMGQRNLYKVVLTEGTRENLLKIISYARGVTLAPPPRKPPSSET